MTKKIYEIIREAKQLKPGKKLDERCAKINGWVLNVFTDNSPAPYSTDVGLAFELLEAIRTHPKTIQVEVILDSTDCEVVWVIDDFQVNNPIELAVADHDKPALAICRAAVVFDQIRERMEVG